MTTRSQSADILANLLGERTVRSITGPGNVPAASTEETEIIATAHSQGQGDGGGPQRFMNCSNCSDASGRHLHKVETGATLAPKESRWRIIIIIATFIVSVLCLGLPNICRRLLADPECKMRGHSPGGCDCHTDSPERWRGQSTRLLVLCYPVTMWGAMTMVAASIAYLQIDDVENNPLTFVIASMSTICAFESSVLSVVFYLGKRRLSGTIVADQWVKASRESNGKSAKFWVLLALPLVWLFWSVILLLVTILVHVWKDLPRANVLGPLSVTALLMVALIQVLWISNVFFNLDEETEEVDEISTLLSVAV